MKVLIAGATGALGVPQASSVNLVAHPVGSSTSLPFRYQISA